MPRSHLATPRHENSRLPRTEGERGVQGSSRPRALSTRAAVATGAGAKSSKHYDQPRTRKRRQQTARNSNNNDSSNGEWPSSRRQHTNRDSIMAGFDGRRTKCMLWDHRQPCGVHRCNHPVWSTYGVSALICARLCARLYMGVFNNNNNNNKELWFKQTVAAATTAR